LIADAQPVAIVLHSANLRAGPGTDYILVGTAHPGDRLPIRGRSEAGDWWMVSTDAAASTAWIFGELVEAQDAGHVPVAPAPPKTAANTVSRSSPQVGFAYGIQAHLGSDVDRVIAATRNLGFPWLKGQLRWKDVEGSPGQVRWSEVDPIIDAVAGADLRLLLTITAAPEWTRPGGDYRVEGPPQDPALYAAFVGQIAGRYCGRLSAIEVWNEPNLAREWGNERIDPARYVKLLRLAYRAVKQACPGLIVVSAGLSPTGVTNAQAMDDYHFLDLAYRAGLKDWSDAIGAHPYGFNNPADARLGYSEPATTNAKGHPSFFFLETLERYHSLMVTHGDARKRIWATEFGWPVDPTPPPGYEYAADNSEWEQSEFTRVAFQLGREAGYVGPMFLWNLNYRIVAPESEMAMWGIVDPTWNPLQTYTTLKGLPK
jgi:hypothetical protein